MKPIPTGGRADRIAMRMFLGVSVIMFSAFTAYILDKMFQMITTSPVDVAVALVLIAIAYAIGYTIDSMFGVIE